MTDALAMYTGVLQELNRVESPDFDVDDFNYFMPQATEKWLKVQLDQFEITQKITDKISCLVKQTSPISLNPNNTTNVKQFDLPGDYRHIVNCLIRLRYKLSTNVYAVGDKREVYTQRYTGDGQVSFTDNYYTKPLVSDSDDRLYHRVIGNKVSVLLDTPKYSNDSVRIETVVMEYIAKAPNIKLNANFTVDIDTVFPEHCNREIVVVCSRLFLDRHESQRKESQIAIDN